MPLRTVIPISTNVAAMCGGIPPLLHATLRLLIGEGNPMQIGLPIAVPNIVAASPAVCHIACNSKPFLKIQVKCHCAKYSSSVLHYTTFAFPLRFNANEFHSVSWSHSSQAHFAYTAFDNVEGIQTDDELHFLKVIAKALVKKIKPLKKLFLIIFIRSLLMFWTPSKRLLWPL